VSVFDRLQGYGFVHHRALNSHEALARTLRNVAAFPARPHVLEGDVCWDFRPGNTELCFRHPVVVFDSLSARRIRKRIEDKTIVGLHDLDALSDSNVCLVIELKVGRGNMRAAMDRLVGYLEARFRGRYWIDSFSLRLLDYIKSVSPQTAVTLHTECVYRSRILAAAPQWPPPMAPKLSSLSRIDGIAIRRRGSEAFMARACRDVHAAGKVLILSRLHTLREFECSKVWGAKAGYMHWDMAELFRLNDEIEARRVAAAAE